MGKSNSEKSTFAKECMFLALKQLMEEKPFDEITISEITARAGVSRTTFYRNFNDKRDIIRDHFQHNPLGAESIAQYDAEHFSLYGRIHDCYVFLYENRVFIRNIIDSNLEELLINNFLSIMKGICAPRAYEHRFIDDYELSALAGMCFMICYDWIKKGMPEPIDEITELSCEIVNKYDNLHK